MSKPATLFTLIPVTSKILCQLGDNELVEEVFELHQGFYREESPEKVNDFSSRDYDVVIDIDIDEKDRPARSNGKYYLTVAQAHQATNIPESTIRHWCQRNKEKGFVKKNPRKYWMIEREAIVRFAETRKNK